MKKVIKNYIEKIENSKVYEVASISPLTKADNLSKELANSIFLKREDLQPTHSLKLGALTTRLLTFINPKRLLKWQQHPREIMPKE